MALLTEIEAAEAHLERLKRQAVAATCAEVGHRWKFIGGSNAGCCDECDCSVSVHECEVCRDCDYGEPERETVIKDCAELTALNL